MLFDFRQLLLVHVLIISGSVDGNDSIGLVGRVVARSRIGDSLLPFHERAAVQMDEYAWFEIEQNFNAICASIDLFQFPICL